MGWRYQIGDRVRYFRAGQPEGEWIRGEIVNIDVVYDVGGVMTTLVIESLTGNTYLFEVTAENIEKSDLRVTFRD